MQMILRIMENNKEERVIDLGKDRNSIGKVLPELKKRWPYLVKIEFTFNNRVAFSYKVENSEHLSKIYPFLSYACSTTAYDAPPCGIGFIDRYKGLRVEFLQGQFMITGARKE